MAAPPCHKNRLPVARSVLRTDALSRLLEREYPLPAPVGASPLSNRSNDVFLVVAADRSRYALRVFPSEEQCGDRVGAESLRFELELLRFARMRGLAVPTVIDRRDGSSQGELEVPEGRRRFALFGFEPGALVPELDRVRARALGRCLARFHLLSDEFTSSADRGPLDESFLLEEPLRRLHTVPGLDPTAVAALDGLGASLAARIRDLVLPAGGWGPLHGDIWWGNALFRGPMPTLLDFEYCGPGWRAYDVASMRGSALA